MHDRTLAEANIVGQAPRLPNDWRLISQVRPVRPRCQQPALFACLHARWPHSLRHAQSCWIEFTGREGRRSDDWLLALVPQRRAEDLALLI